METGREEGKHKGTGKYGVGAASCCCQLPIKLNARRRECGAPSKLNPFK